MTQAGRKAGLEARWPNSEFALGKPCSEVRTCRSESGRRVVVQLAHGIIGKS